MKRGARCATARRVTESHTGRERLGTCLAHLKGGPILDISSKEASASALRGSIKHSKTQRALHILNMMKHVQVKTT